jgi:methyl-accepting chemotaxis protein
MHSIRARILALTAVPTLALAAVALLATLVLGHLADDLRREDAKLKVLRAHGTMDMMHDALRGDALRALAATTPGELNQVRTDAEAHAARFRSEFEIIRVAPSSNAVRTDIAALAPNLDAYAEVVTKVIAAAQTDRAAGLALMPELDQRFRSLETANAALGDKLEAIGDDVDDILAQAPSGRNQVIVICLVAAIVTIGGGILIGRRLVRSMTEAARVLHAIAGGDVSSRATVDDSSEVGAMLQSLNTTLDHICDMLATIRDTSREVQCTATEVDQVAAKLGANSQRASHDTANASSGATQASGNVQMVAAATEQIAATIRDVARNAQEAARVAANGVGIASRSNASVARLGLSSNEIGAVVDVITQIAEQTNLLALNATIEAARAGAAGPRLRRGRQRDQGARQADGARHRGDPHQDRRHPARHRDRGRRHRPDRRGHRPDRRHPAVDRLGGRRAGDGHQRHRPQPDRGGHRRRQHRPRRGRRRPGHPRQRQRGRARHLDRGHPRQPVAAARPGGRGLPAPRAAHQHDRHDRRAPPAASRSSTSATSAAAPWREHAAHL